MAKALTEKQRRFVEAYMGAAAGNGTEACRLAGYSGSVPTLANMAKENLRKPYIAHEIDRLAQEDPLTASRVERQRFYTSLVRDDKEETRDRLKACELLGRTQGDFIERREIIQPVGSEVFRIKLVEDEPYEVHK